MRDEAEVLLEMYKAQVARSEHYEELRSSITNVILSLGAAFIALIAVDGKLSPIDAWWGGCLLLLGSFGYAASRLHSARSHRHGKRAEAYRGALDALLPDAGINRVRATVPDEHTWLHRIWSALYLVIVLAGAVIVAASIAAPR